MISFLDLFNRINEIIDLYYTYHDLWNNERNEKINFSKKTVYDLKHNINLLIEIKRINNFVFEKISEEIFQIFDISRVKNDDSINKKIDRYCKNKENGKIPIKKCLNDLIGFRYIINLEKDLFILQNELNNNENIYLNNNDKIKMKILNLDKNGYKAIHLYISIDNSCLPWELQIWRKLDYKKNEDAHFKKYGRY